VFVDINAFDLMEENMGTGGDVLVAEAAARSDDPNGRRMALHGANLDVAGVGAEKVIGVEVEGILHVAGWVIFGEVQSLEVIVVSVNIGAELDGKAHADEDVEDALEHLLDRVDAPLVLFAPWESGIDPFAGELGLELFEFNAGEAVFAVESEFFFELVDHFAEMGPLVRSAVF